MINQISRQMQSRIRYWKLFVIAMATFALAACATPFRADVSRFQAGLPTPSGQTFVILPQDPTLAGGIEYSEYAQRVAGHLIQFGYQQTSNADTADLVVHFNYGVDNGQSRIRTYGADPYWGGPWGWGPSWGGWGWGSGWGPWGWGGPSWGWGGSAWGGSRIDAYTVYTSAIELKISRRADQQRVFEGRAEAVSTSNRLQYIVPNLIEALFTDFPGNSGETVRVKVPVQSRDTAAPASKPTPSPGNSAGAVSSAA